MSSQQAPPAIAPVSDVQALFDGYAEEFDHHLVGQLGYDVVAFMAGAAERFDLVLAADVFIYIGDLDPVFAAVRRVTDRGVFCFSVELTEDPGAHFDLLPSLRYAHGEAYLRQLASKHGFGVIEFRPATLREEQRRPVAGLFVYLRA